MTSWPDITSIRPYWVNGTCNWGMKPEARHYPMAINATASRAENICCKQTQPASPGWDSRAIAVLCRFHVIAHNCNKPWPSSNWSASRPRAVPTKEPCGRCRSAPKKGSPVPGTAQNAIISGRENESSRSWSVLITWTNRTAFKVEKLVSLFAMLPVKRKESMALSIMRKRQRVGDHAEW